MSIAMRLVAAALVVAGFSSACGQGTCTVPPVRQSPVDGVVVAVTATGLTAVQNFTVRQSDGSEVVFQVGTIEDATVFPPGHLKEHQASSSPVRVWFTAKPDRTLVAYRLDDASGPTPQGSPITFSCS